MSQIVLLTLNEAAARLRCTVAKVQRLCLDGDLTFLPGRPLLVPEEALNAYIAGKLRHGCKSASPAISDIRSAEDIAYDEVELTLQAMAKRNGGKLSSTPQIRKMIEPFMHRPGMVRARRRGMIARYELEKQEAASAQKEAAARSKAEKAGRDPNAEPKRSRRKTRKAQSKRPQSKRSEPPAT
jgi:excisionase family DNA binding protein